MPEDESLPGVPFNPNEKPLPPVVRRQGSEQEELPPRQPIEPRIYQGQDGSITDETGRRILDTQTLGTKANEIAVKRGVTQEEMHTINKIQAELKTSTQS